MYVCLCAWMVVYVCMCASVFPVLCAGVCMCAFACFPFTLRGRLQTVYGLQLSFNAVSSFLLFYIYLSLSLSLFSLLSFLFPLSSLFSLSLSLSCLFDPPLSKVSILTYISSTLSHSNSVHPRLLPNRLSGRGSLEVYVFWCLKQNYQKVEAWTPPIQLIS